MKFGIRIAVAGFAMLLLAGAAVVGQELPRNATDKIGYGDKALVSAQQNLGKDKLDLFRKYLFQAEDALREAEGMVDESLRTHARFASLRDGIAVLRTQAAEKGIAIYRDLDSSTASSLKSIKGNLDSCERFLDSDPTKALGYFNSASTAWTQFEAKLKTDQETNPEVVQTRERLISLRQKTDALGGLTKLTDAQVASLARIEKHLDLAERRIETDPGLAAAYFGYATASFELLSRRHGTSFSKEQPEVARVLARREAVLAQGKSQGVALPEGEPRFAGSGPGTGEPKGDLWTSLLGLNAALLRVEEKIDEGQFVRAIESMGEARSAREAVAAIESDHPDALLALGWFDLLETACRSAGAEVETLSRVIRALVQGLAQVVTESEPLVQEIDAALPTQRTPDIDRARRALPAVREAVRAMESASETLRTRFPDPDADFPRYMADGDMLALEAKERLNRANSLCERTRSILDQNCEWYVREAESCIHVGELAIESFRTETAPDQRKHYARAAGERVNESLKYLDWLGVVLGPEPTEEKAKAWTDRAGQVVKRVEEIQKASAELLEIVAEEKRQRVANARFPTGGLEGAEWDALATTVRERFAADWPDETLLRVVIAAPWKERTQVVRQGSALVVEDFRYVTVNMASKSGGACHVIVCEYREMRRADGTFEPLTFWGTSDYYEMLEENLPR